MRCFTAVLIILAGVTATQTTAREPIRRTSGVVRTGYAGLPPQGPYSDYRSSSGAELSGRITFDPQSNVEPMSFQPSPYRSQPPVSSPYEVPSHEATPQFEEPDFRNESTSEPCGQPYCCGGRFLSARFGTLILNRSRPHNETLFFDAFTPTQAINANQFNPGWAAGFDAGLTFHNLLGNGVDLESRYFGIDDWSSQQTLTTTGASVIINNNPPTAIVGPRTITSDFSSSLFSFETNTRIWNQDRTFGFLFGGRSLQLNEDLNTEFAPDPAAGLANFRYDVATRNHLYGGQAGIQFALIRNCCSCWDGYLKGGLLANCASNESVATSLVAPPVLFPSNNSAWNLAYIAEAGVTGRQKITDNWSLYLGYQALYIDGVALATEQIQSTDVGSATGLNHSAGVFYHGGRIGLEYSF